MATRLADRLRAARHRQFVGRENERTLFRSALEAPDLPFSVLHVFGPGGVGKTTLLKEFVYLAEQEGVTPLYIDARNVEAAPGAFVAALQQAKAGGRRQKELNAEVRMKNEELAGVAEEAAEPHPEHSAFFILHSAFSSNRQVILVDTYETLTPLDAWLREVFLPEMPDNVLVVLAGRNPPPAAWRTDPGWQNLVRVMPLRNLSPEESRTYLAQRNLPGDRYGDVLDFTHGHPLALSLVADVYSQRGDMPFKPGDNPDVVRALLEQLVQKVPGPAHRTALEACALVRLTTEELLSEVLRIPDSHELFEWLRGLSFIESGRQGLFPHDLAREALVADLHWRNPAWYKELHGRARNYYARRLQETHGLNWPEAKNQQQRVLFDYIFLHRDNAMVRPFLEWQESGSMVADAPRPEDIPALVEMVRRHEGDESARLAERWFARQPEGLIVIREPDKRIAGFLMVLALQGAAAEDIEADPAARAAWAYLQLRAPLRPGEIATHFRYWMSRDEYQSVSPVQSVILVNMVRHYLTTRGLAFTFFPAADPAFWAPLCEYSEIPRIPEADYDVGGKHYGTYGHDWRAQPPVAWLSLLADKEIAEATDAPPPDPRQAGPLVVLSEPEFAGAVRDALRDLAQPQRLRGNPLLQSKLVVERAGMSGDTGSPLGRAKRSPASGPAERIAALQELIKKAAEQLQQTPREAKLYRALYHTYIQPAPTQEQAAELLDLPFSTYRRHLKTSVDRVTEILWAWEAGEL